MKRITIALLALVVLLAYVMPALAQTAPPGGSPPGSSGGSGSSGSFVLPLLDWGDSDGDGIPNFYEGYLAPLVGNPGCNYPGSVVFDPASEMLAPKEVPGLPGYYTVGVVSLHCYQTDAPAGTEADWYAVSPQLITPFYAPPLNYRTVYWSYSEAQQTVFYSGIGGIGMARLDLCANAIEPTLLAFNLLPADQIHPVAQAICGVTVAFLSVEGLQRALQAQWQLFERLALNSAAADTAAHRPPSLQTQMLTMYARAAYQAYVWSLTISSGMYP